ncbi:uncharacterized protein HD556DRAFT_1440870 [Suillus plorans]|uniref:Uncharacterized protein n=1 Tax=Suillus plorans TaxID=116603 RepID=A0A9P7IXS0_9AGAM|nr:uncharacterized protein HD556DRAFT_1440870 [Suillus plorans]KAG1797313.1 hypothetical protein HD556DRAFT_1440870 [Suillus plorans]
MPPAAMSSARRADGSLKDASEIAWYNDAEDDSPMVPPPAPAHNGTLNLFVRRSGRAVKPTEKIRETLTASSTSAKRSAVEPPQGVPAPKRVFVGTSSREDDEDDDEDAPALEDVTDDEEEDAENAENAENEEAYQRTKKLGDQDREDRKSLKKDERSADLTTVFTFEKGHINPHTQERENGWWCEVCKANNVPLHQCFFKGGISTRRTHIARHPKCHYPVYHDRCKERGIKMHNRAIPRDCKATDSQATLDGSLTPKIPTFMKSGLMDYIVELIVAEDEQNFHDVRLVDIFSWSPFPIHYSALHRLPD